MTQSKQLFSFLTVLVLAFISSNVSAQTAPSTINAIRIAEVDQSIQVLSASHDTDNPSLLIVGHDGVVHFWNPQSGVRDTPFLDLGVNGLNILDFGGNS
ncbi:MAG: hypothetical protein H8E97_05295, partial [Bacteroidetes bacterium]|nr:hypothetical protein [Bacteroidota bacterium]